MRKKVESISTEIEMMASEQSLGVMPQTLSVTGFLKQIYAYSVDLADLVV